MKKRTQRYWEIDFFRGIAVILMITYHILFDLDFLGIISLPLDNPAFRLFLYPIGTLFLILVGVSLVISYQRYYDQRGVKPSVLKYIKRSLFLLSIALFITGATWIYPHDGFIVFGVIHCISISIVISYFFIKRPLISLVIGLIIVTIGLLFSTLSVSNPYLFWLGLKTRSFYTLDFFPLFPWLGVVLIGVFLGNHIIPKLRKKHVKIVNPPSLVEPFSFLGRHALVVYLVHQPILFGILFLFS